MSPARVLDQPLLLSAINYPPPDRGAKYCDLRSVSALYLSARITRKRHARLHEIFCTLPVALARSSCDNRAICYINDGMFSHNELNTYMQLVNYSP